MQDMFGAQNNENQMLLNNADDTLYSDRGGGDNSEPSMPRQPSRNSSNVHNRVLSIHEANLKAQNERENRVSRVHRRVNAPRGVNYGYEDADLAEAVFERTTPHVQWDTHYSTGGYFNADTEVRLHQTQFTNYMESNDDATC